MPSVGSMQNLIKYSSNDVSVIPDGLNTLDLMGKRKICISIVGDVTGASDLVDITWMLLWGACILFPRPMESSAPMQRYKSLMQ